MADKGWEEFYKVGDEVTVSQTGRIVEVGYNYITVETDNGDEIQASSSSGWDID